MQWRKLPPEGRKGQQLDNFYKMMVPDRKLAVRLGSVNHLLSMQNSITKVTLSAVQVRNTYFGYFAKEAIPLLISDHCFDILTTIWDRAG